MTAEELRHRATVVTALFHKERDDYSHIEEDVGDDDYHEGVTTSSPSSSPSSLIGPTCNLCSATLGAGVLALPFALQQAGLIFGLLLLIFAAITTYYSLSILVQACDILQLDTYEAIVQRALGTRARRITELSILLFCIGCAIAYLIAVGDILQSLMIMGNSGNERTLGMVWTWAIAMVPLSLLRKMTSLQHASGIGIFSIFLLVAVVHVHLFQDWTTHHDKKWQSSSILWPANGGSFTSVLVACPLVLFAFSCQVNVCQLYQEMSDYNRKQEGMNRVLLVAVGICAGLYTSISCAANLDFTVVAPNILQNLCPHDSLLIQAAYGGMMIAVVMAFPLNIFPVRTTLEGIVLTRRKNNYNQELELEDTSSFAAHEEPLLLLSSENFYDAMEQESVDDDNFSWTLHIVVTLAIVSLTLVVALVAPNITTVFGLLGGTTSSLLGFILPGMIGVRILESERDYIQSRLLVWSGVVICILTTAVTIYTTFVPTAGNMPLPNPCNATTSLNNATTTS